MREESGVLITIHKLFICGLVKLGYEKWGIEKNR